MESLRLGRNVGEPPLSWLAVFVVLSACVPATVNYKGPRQSPYDVARISGKETVIESVDGVAQAAAEFEVLPGRHTVVVNLGEAPRSPFEVGQYRSAQAIPICFTANKGVVYSVIASETADGRWWPNIIDAQAGSRVPSQLGIPGSQSCFDKSPWSNGTAVVRAEPRAAAASSSPNIQNAEGTLTAGAYPPALSGAALDRSVSSDGSSSPAPVSNEPEVLAGRPAPRRVTNAPSAPSLTQSGAQKGPGSGLGLSVGYELGFARGGDVIAAAKSPDGTKEELRAGDAESFGVSASITPFWVERTIGFGVSGSAGFKLAMLRSGQTYASNVRSGVGTSIHALVPVWRRLLLLLRGGLHREFILSVGDAYHSNIGSHLDVGALWFQDAHTSYSVSARFSRLSYLSEKASIDAGSSGVLLSVHFYR